MKDKTLYWILGLMAAYFVVRFIMNQRVKKKSGYADILKQTEGRFPEGLALPKCPKCGSDMLINGNSDPNVDGGWGFECTNPECGYIFVS